MPLFWFRLLAVDLMLTEHTHEQKTLIKRTRPPNHMRRTKHQQCTTATYAHNGGLTATSSSWLVLLAPPRKLQLVLRSPQRDDHAGAIARRRNEAVAAVARLGEILFSEPGEKTLRHFILD